MAILGVKLVPPLSRLLFLALGILVLCFLILFAYTFEFFAGTISTIGFTSKIYVNQSTIEQVESRHNVTAANWRSSYCTTWQDECTRCTLVSNELHCDARNSPTTICSAKYTYCTEAIRDKLVSFCQVYFAGGRFSTGDGSVLLLGKIYHWVTKKTLLGTVAIYNEEDKYMADQDAAVLQQYFQHDANKIGLNSLHRAQSIKASDRNFIGDAIVCLVSYN